MAVPHSFDFQNVAPAVSGKLRRGADGAG